MGEEMKPLGTSRGRYLCYIEKEIFRELILRKLRGRSEDEFTSKAASMLLEF
jgi:hypothetical protein